MAHDVFISYSSHDKAVADAICAALEVNKIRCWIAPRDVMPGVSWAGSIIDALNSCKVMVLVLSQGANASGQVSSEVERAASKGIPIIPFRIQDVALSKDLELFISKRHWLDALVPPLEEHISKLVQIVSAVLSTETGQTISSIDVIDVPREDTMPKSVSTPSSSPASGPNARAFLLVGVPVVLIVAVVIAVFSFMKGGEPNTLAAGTPASTKTSALAQATIDANVKTTPLSQTQNSATATRPAADAAAKSWTLEPVKVLDVGDQVNSTSISFDGKTVATLSGQKTLQYWDLASGQLVRTFSLGTWIEQIALSPDGKTLASGGGEVKLWDVATGKELAKLSTDADLPVFSPDGKVLAYVGCGQTNLSGCRETVKRWETSTGSELSDLKGHDETVSGIAFAPDGKTVATSSWDHTVKLWDLGNEQELRTMRGHTTYVYSVAYSPDGKLVASGAVDGEIRIWDVATGKSLFSMKEHNNDVSGLVFTPDSKVLISAGWDAKIRLWDVATGQRLRAVSGHTDPIKAMALSSDGKTLVTGAQDSTARIWSLRQGQ